LQLFGTPNLSEQETIGASDFILLPNVLPLTHFIFEQNLEVKTCQLKRYSYAEKAEAACDF
jgi:hypothetical protein